MIFRLQKCQKYVLCDTLDARMGKYVSSMGPGIYLKGWNYLKKYKHIHISSVINPTDFGYFQQFEKNLESNWHWLKMVKNGHFLVKNEFQRPRLGGGLFDRKKRVPFVVVYGFWSMEIVSEPATPA